MNTYNIWFKEELEDGTDQVSEVTLQADSAREAIAKAVEMAKKFGNELSPSDLHSELV